MVNLPDPSEQPARPRRERGCVHCPRFCYNYRIRNRRGGSSNRSEPSEPKGLLELEALAQRSVVLMEKYGPKSEKNFDIAMDLLRLQYNLNFIVVCEKCRGPHVNDELIAPER